MYLLFHNTMFPIDLLELVLIFMLDSSNHCKFDFAEYLSIQRQSKGQCFSLQITCSETIAHLSIRPSYRNATCDTSSVYNKRIEKLSKKSANNLIF